MLIEKKNFKFGKSFANSILKAFFACNGAIKFSFLYPCVRVHKYLSILG